MMFRQPRWSMTHFGVNNMKIKKNYLLKTIADQYVVVPVGEEAIRFNGIISLNKSGKRLFEYLQEDHTDSELIEFMMSIYDVSETKAKEDVNRFIKTLKENNLLDE